MRSFGRWIVRTLPAAAAVAGLLALGSCGGDDAAKPDTPHAPELAQPGGLTVTEESVETVGVSAVDPDGDPITLTVNGLPDFASFADHGDGTGTITLSPVLGDAGSYPGVTITAEAGDLADSVTATVTVTPLPRIDGALRYEPPAFCLGGAGESKTLILYNASSEELTFRVSQHPADMTITEGLMTTPANSAFSLDWTWTPAGPYPVLDTLELATNNSSRPVISIPLRRQDPAGSADIIPPSAPLLFLPEDGAVFTLQGGSVLIDVAWSELDDCSGIDYYKIEIAPTPQFTNVLCCRDTIQTSLRQVEAQSGDEGLVYWRVYAVDNAGLKGAYSDVRSWTVVRP